MGRPRSVGRTGRWLLFAGLAWPARGFAGDRLQLPPGESGDQWQVPVQLAGLELGQGVPDVTCVRIESRSDGWVLRATGVDGSVRVARVDPPTTPAQREDVAFLARSLARTLAPGGAPAPVIGARTASLPAPPSVEPLPLPPPPPPPAPRPEPVAAATPVAAEPVVVPSVEVPPGPAPVRWETVMLPEGTVTAERASDFGFVETLVELDAPSRARRRPKPHGRMEVPPMAFGSSVAVVRPGVDVGFCPRFGIDFARIGSTSVGYDLSWVPQRDLDLVLNRQYAAVDLTLHAAAHIGGRLRIGPVAGVSWRAYRQQFHPIGAGVTPVVGLLAGVDLVRIHHWSLGADAHGTMDLVPTNFELPTGRIRTLSPFELQTGLVIRFSGTGDPNPNGRTSSR